MGESINQHSLWLIFRMVSRNLGYFRFLCERVSRFFVCHVIKFFWQILKYFLDFKTKKNFSYTWEHSGARNKNVNKFFVKICVALHTAKHIPQRAFLVFSHLKWIWCGFVLIAYLDDYELGTVHKRRHQSRGRGVCQKMILLNKHI